MRRLWHRMFFNSLSLEDYNLSLYDEQWECLASKAGTGNHDASADLFFSNVDKLDWLQLEWHVEGMPRNLLGVREKMTHYLPKYVSQNVVVHRKGTHSLPRGAPSSYPEAFRLAHLIAPIGSEEVRSLNDEVVAKKMASTSLSPVEQLLTAGCRCLTETLMQRRPMTNAQAELSCSKGLCQ